MGSVENTVCVAVLWERPGRVGKQLGLLALNNFGLHAIGVASSCLVLGAVMMKKEKHCLQGCSAMWRMCGS